MTTPHTTTGYRYAPVPEALLYSSMSHLAVRVYACLQRHGMDPASCYPSHARIAELIGCQQRSVQRPLRELEAAGWVKRVRRSDEAGARTTDGFHVRTSPDTDAALHSAPPTLLDAGGTAQADRAAPRAEREQVNDSPVNERAAAARELVGNVWERANPKPATPFIAAVRIAEKLLAAGHDRQAIGRAMLAAPTITTAAVELQLSRDRGTRRAVPPSADRSAPSGRVAL